MKEKQKAQDRTTTTTSLRTASSLSSSDETSTTPPLLHCTARRVGPRCPFGNDKVEFALRPGSCVCLTGASGRGKTSIALSVAGLTNAKYLEQRLDLQVTCTWDGHFPVSERCGVLLQQTTLVDELTVASNLALALQKQQQQSSKHYLDRRSRDAQIADLLHLVGLEASKEPQAKNNSFIKFHKIFFANY